MLAHHSRPLVAANYRRRPKAQPPHFPQSSLSTRADGRVLEQTSRIPTANATPRAPHALAPICLRITCISAALTAMCGWINSTVISRPRNIVCVRNNRRCGRSNQAMAGVFVNHRMTPYVPCSGACAAQVVA